MPRPPDQKSLAVPERRTHDDDDAAPDGWTTIDGLFKIREAAEGWQLYSIKRQRVLSTWRTREALDRHLEHLYKTMKRDGQRYD